MTERDRLDLAYGRRGGHLQLASERRLVVHGSCPVCGDDMMTVRRAHHYLCSRPMSCCGAPSDLVGDRKKHRADCAGVNRMPLDPAHSAAVHNYWSQR